jgi:hypothetical protein
VMLSQRWAVEPSKIHKSLTMPTASQDSLQVVDIQCNPPCQRIVCVPHEQMQSIEGNIQKLQNGSPRSMTLKLYKMNAIFYTNTNTL